MLIKDIMTKNPICVSEKASIVEAKEIMTKNNFSKLPVVDGSKKLVGIITKNDISKASPSDATTLDKYEINSLLAKLTCGKCMTKEVRTVTEDVVIEEVARIMIDEEIGCVPVVEDEIITGIVTESDLFKVFTDMFGARYSGVRANFHMADKPGALAQLLKQIADTNGNVISVVTRESEVNGCKRVTVKADNITEAQLKSFIENCGATIIDIREVK